MPSLSISCKIIIIPGTYSSGVLPSFSGAFLMSLLGAVIGILFFFFLVCRFFPLTIKIGAVGSFEVCILD